MPDHFAMLRQPRRPWLDPDQLKATFLELSGTLHPDRHHSGSAALRAQANTEYAALNAAYNCLRDAKERLRHLLTLESGAKPTDLQVMPADLADFFLQMNSLTRQVAAFLKERSAETSPLLRVNFFEQSHEWSQQLLALQQRLASSQAATLESLRELDKQWIDRSNRDSLLPELERTWRLLSFYARWTGQVQSLLTQLSF
jgi:DnaJ-domain-containing protein 1